MHIRPPPFSAGCRCLPPPPAGTRMATPPPPAPPPLAVLRGHTAAVNDVDFHPTARALPWRGTPCRSGLFPISVVILCHRSSCGGGVVLSEAGAADGPEPFHRRARNSHAETITVVFTHMASVICFSICWRGGFGAQDGVVCPRVSSGRC